MRVSIIIPVRNEAPHLCRTLRRLADQDFPATDFEILVVDGRSDDGTPEIVGELRSTIPNLYLFDNPKRWASAGRNVGLRHAGGKYVVIVDGHCQVRDRQFLRNLVDAFEASGADTLGRPQPLKCDHPTPFQRAVAAARTSWLGHNPDSDIYSDEAKFVPADNVAVAYRRDVFDLMGEFDESFDACEDVEFNTRVRRAGLTCYFTPAVTVEYEPRGTLGGLFYQMARYGRGRARLARKCPATVTMPSLVPPACLVMLMLGGLAGLAWWPLGLAAIASLAVYLFVVLAESLRLGRASAPMSRLPVAFAAIHVGFGWGYLRELAAGLGQWPAIAIRRMIAITATPARTAAGPGKSGVYIPGA
jgi:succinoglycan biosynthesis protein ExoA